MFGTKRLAFGSRYLLLRRCLTTEALHGRNLYVAQNVISQEQHELLVAFLDPILARKKYEGMYNNCRSSCKHMVALNIGGILHWLYVGDHWDSVITAYKETELHPKRVPPNVQSTLDEFKALVRRVLDRPDEEFLPLHVIDLDSSGYIGGHVDSIKFSGDFIAGLSLLSTRTMVLERAKVEDVDAEIVAKYCEERKQAAIEMPECIPVVLPPRSMYIITGPLRYQYTHAVLGGEECQRRISIICRNARGWGHGWEEKVKASNISLSQDVVHPC